MLGPRKIDPVAFSLLDITVDAGQPHALRRLAERFAARDATIACVRGVESGDALALATRFDRGWAYRGGTALFWHRALVAHQVHDRYMPISVLHPFERRAAIHVHAECDGTPLALVAVSFGRDRMSRIRDMRFVRTLARDIDGAAICFAGNATRLQSYFARMHFERRASDGYNLIVARPSHATPAPQTAGSHDAPASIERI